MLNIWFWISIALAFLLALSLWKNITSWSKLKTAAVDTLSDAYKDLLAQLAAHQADANALKAKEIDVARAANPAANPNVASNGVSASDRKS